MEHVNKLKRENEALEDQVSSTNEASDSLRLEITRLKVRVVHSPEKIQQAISDLNVQITEAREQLRSNELKSRKLMTKIDLLEHLHQDILTCIRQMEECKEAVDEQENEMQKLHHDRGIVSQIESDIRGLTVSKEVNTHLYTSLYLSISTSS